MELLQYRNAVFEFFQIKNASELSTAIMEKGFSENIFDEYIRIVGDLKKDWLKHLFQYYIADRNKKQQDFTPYSICELVNQLSGNANVIYDCCAGTGALTIEKAKDNKDALFICEELDEDAIPFLLFNLAIRNIKAFVINKNVLTKETKAQYAVIKGIKYATVEKIVGDDLPIDADISISNPPYNIPWEAPAPIEALSDTRFNKCEIPPKSNANYAFILNCIERATHKASLILPNGVLNSEGTEKEIRKYLIENNLLESVVILPDKMFEVTSIATCILTFNKQKKSNEVSFVDCRKTFDVEIREQNGQYGGNSHMNRTYKKEYKVLNESHISAILAAINEKKAISEFSITVSNDEIIKNDFNFSPSRYIKFTESENEHRNYNEIAENINYISKMQNSCKLVINETIAKNIGLDIETFEQGKENSRQLQKQMKQLGIPIEIDDYIQFTKNKNEFVFKCNDKEILPDILLQFLSIWKNQIALLNTMQNQYLKELRDALLPDLMSGKIEL